MANVIPRGVTALAAATLLSFAIVPSATAQSAEARAPVFSELLGAWTGNGELMGRPARFEMCWDEILGGAFIRLRFANHFVGASTDQRAIESMGFYPAGAEGGKGTWVDSRGVVFALAVQPRGSRALSVTWTGERESGRTQYELQSDSALAVTDEVLTAGEYRVFARSTLRRGGRAICA
jgi:hypothetical protein